MRRVLAVVGLCVAMGGRAADVSVTPYGFIAAGAYWSDGNFAVKDYPGQVGPLDTTNSGNGAFIVSMRQSRVGVRASAGDLPYELKAGAAVEIDGLGGNPTATNSTAWQNPVVRVRIAYATLGYGDFQLRIGQDFGLVNPLFATSIAWCANPLFWQAGNAYDRVGQIRLSWIGTSGAFAYDVAAAMVTPLDGEPTVDNGPGNRSRSPGFEARVGGAYDAGTAKVALGVGGHMHTRRYYGTPQGDADVTAHLVGIDGSVAAFGDALEVKGEWYTSRGADDTYAGMLGNSVGTVSGMPLTAWASGWWVQGLARPLPGFKPLALTAGYGVERASANDLETGGFGRESTRTRNSMVSAGVLLFLNKSVRFGLELVHTESTYLNGSTYAADQYAFSSQFVF